MSLHHHFRLHVKLRWPYRRIVVVAELDYNPTEPNQLPLQKGAQVVVLSKEADHMGWWKGKANDRVRVDGSKALFTSLLGILFS